MVLDPSRKMLLTSEQVLTQKPKSYFLVPIVLFFILTAFCASSIVYTVLRINQLQTELDAAVELLEFIHPFALRESTRAEEPSYDFNEDQHVNYDDYHDYNYNDNDEMDNSNGELLFRKRRSIEINTEDSKSYDSSEATSNDALIIPHTRIAHSRLHYADGVQEHNQDHVTEAHLKSRNGRLRHRQKQQRLEAFEEPHAGPRFLRGRLLAAHFNGNSSKYIVGQHTNYKGNGHMRHLDQKYVDWVASDWVQALGMGQNFKMDNGVLTLKESGLFLVYAQVYYFDYHDMNGYRVFKNDNPILQCTTMTHSDSRVIKGNTCYTSGVEYLAEGDKLSVVDISQGRYSIFDKEKSFFGIVQLSDFKMK